MQRGWIDALALALVVTLPACQTTPDLGTLGRVQVIDVPTKRSDIAANQQVPESLEVYEPEIRQSRLIRVNCGRADANAYVGIRYWNGLVVPRA